MHISKVYIENFKCFKGVFEFKLNEGLNVLVGDNEAGKSTIIEAIHLALTGLLNGKYLKNELTQYVFNTEVVMDYLNALNQNKLPSNPPYIQIEVFMEGPELAEFEGDGNSKKEKACGFSLKIAFDEKFQREYEDLLKMGSIKTLPIEYYNVYWSTFARDENITPRLIPIKSALIDSSSNRQQNGSDIYIARIIREFLESSELVEISQAHRKMKETFMEHDAIGKINQKIKTATKISDKKVELSVELSSKNAWENSLMTYLDDVPFHYIGKGEQCIIKTKLALGHKKAKEANIVLLEEPENHLSHTKLNQLISEIKNDNNQRQVLISTHSSFVANKLGLDNLVLLNDRRTVKLNQLDNSTESFFQKLSGYDTLRLILCAKAILVEGDSDELVVQKAFMSVNGGALPIEKGVDVISVGTSFLRFLEIAEKINKPVAVVTDNDGDVRALGKKYEAYLDKDYKGSIKICFDNVVDSGDLEIEGKKFNYNTLEPKILKANSLQFLNKILGTTHGNENEMHKYMRLNKTECALKIFSSDQTITFPQYILDAIND